MLRVEKLTIHNIGPFDHTELVFPDKINPGKAEIQLFVGENGTGKTTILEMLASAIFPYQQLHRRSRHNNEASAFTLHFNNGTLSKWTKNGNSFSYLPNVTFKQYIDSIDYIYNPNTEFEFAFYAYSGYRKIGAHNITGIKQIETSPFDNALNFEASVNPAVLLDWIANQKTKEALALMRKDTKTATDASRSITRIEDAIEKITGDKIEFQLLDNPLRVNIGKAGIDLDFDLLPDGLKSIISWMSDLLMRLDRTKWKDNIDVLDRNFILLLDEIDVHLHPAWQRKVLPIVQDLFKNAQIFVTTHSPFVVGSADGVWIHKLILDGNNTKIAAPTLSENSKSYQLILDEVFDIHEFFGVGVEEKLKEFRQLRNKIIEARSLSEHHSSQLKELVDYFKKENSIEIDNIIGSELRQLSRLLNQNLSYL